MLQKRKLPDAAPKEGPQPPCPTNPVPEEETAGDKSDSSGELVLTKTKPKSTVQRTIEETLKVITVYRNV